MKILHNSYAPAGKCTDVSLMSDLFVLGPSTHVHLMFDNELACSILSSAGTDFFVLGRPPVISRNAAQRRVATAAVS